jgi:type III pantothenate kinase
MSSEFVLTVDVGNTRTKFGVFETRPGRDPQPMALTGIKNCPGANAARCLQDWCLSAVASVSFNRAVVAGSNPEWRDDLLSHWPFPALEPCIISDRRQVPVELDVEFPDRVGTDRILNALAISQTAQPGHACIVVDSGTATTIDLVTHGPLFRGGSIMPGIRLSAHAMHDYTARLPLLGMDHLWNSQPAIPARNTEDAMLAGLLYGHLGAVRELVYRMCESIAVLVDVSCEDHLILTGGGGRFLQQHMPSSRYIDCLALHGLAMIKPS